jgi:hypothetical protein
VNCGQHGYDVAHQRQAKYWTSGFVTVPTLLN